MRKNENDNAIEIECFVKIPSPSDISDSDHEHTSLFTDELGFMKYNAEACKAYVCKRGHFRKTKDPISVIEAFLLTYRNGLYPPLWVLNYLAECFEKYYEINIAKAYSFFGGHYESLDKIMGLTGGKGQRPKYKNTVLEYFYEQLMFGIAKLKIIYNLNQSCAAWFVSKATYKNEKCPEYDEFFLYDLYRKRKSLYEDKIFKDIYQSSSEEEKRDIARYHLEKAKKYLEDSGNKEGLQLCNETLKQLDNLDLPKIGKNLSKIYSIASRK